MSRHEPTTILDKLFKGGVLIKGASGLIELTSAVLLIFISPNSIRGFIAFATQHELRTDPHDILANLLLHPTVGLIALTTFDILVLWLIWREYRKIRFNPA